MDTMKNEENDLNSLLEDALSDLLSSPTASTTLASSSVKDDDASSSVAPVQSEDAKKSNSKVAGDFNEEDMNKFFENMTQQLKAELPKIDPQEAKARINESVPQIFDLMQNLLSKELLYPALKDLSPKFDEWLKKNVETLSKADKRRYTKQKNIINEIIDVFDDESLSTQQKFERNLDLMEKMQTLGSPPDELTVPPGMDRCSIM